MEKSSQNGGNQLFNGDVSDNNNSVAYQASLSSSHPMMGEKDTSKASDCNDSSSATSGKKDGWQRNKYKLFNIINPFKIKLKS